VVPLTDHATSPPLDSPLSGVGFGGEGTRRGEGGGGGEKGDGGGEAGGGADGGGGGRVRV
jgi:hypothetical protein